MDLSGHERDKLFLSRQAHDLIDVSYLSGADGIEDARAFAKADLDRDGFEDLIVVNRNAPLLRIYRNQLGPASKHHMIGIRIEGARQRDAVGARLTASACGITQTREVAIGAGFATVDGMAVTLGLGTCAQVDHLVVQFPHGERRAFENVVADQFYRVVEGKGIQRANGIYGRPASEARTTPTVPSAPNLAALVHTAPGGSPFVLVDVFATWCEACARTAPRLDALVAAMTGRLDAISVTIEPGDDRAALDHYRHDHPSPRPSFPYDAAIAAELAGRLGTPAALPSTLVVDRTSGEIVFQTRGTPTRSDLERAVWKGR
jgi:thiol-disulfide isomerase/thioredoxin